jgi:hypothetical protein
MHPPVRFIVEHCLYCRLFGNIIFTADLETPVKKEDDLNMEKDLNLLDLNNLEDLDLDHFLDLDLDNLKDLDLGDLYLRDLDNLEDLDEALKLIQQ